MVCLNKLIQFHKSFKDEDNATMYWWLIDNPNRTYDQYKKKAERLGIKYYTEESFNL